MFKKRIRVFAILFSVFLMVVLSAILANHEMNVYQDKEKEADGIAQNSKEEWQVYTSLANICYLRKETPISAEKFIDRIIGNIDFRRNDVMYFPERKQYEVWSYMDYPAGPTETFRSATMQEASAYYKKSMISLIHFYPGFSAWYWIMKFLLLIGVSSIPSLLSFLSSLFALNFPITAPILAISLLFLTIIRGHAQDTTILKLNTSTTGDKHSLSLAMLNLGNKSGGLVMLADKGIRGAYGPLWKFSKGMVLFPVGIVCGKGEDGARVEHVSFWSILMLKFGKFNQVFMGSYNQPVVRNLSPYAFAKQVISCDFSRIRLGIRADYSFQKQNKWKKLITFGPVFEFLKKNFTIHFHATVSKPYTIKTEWQVAF